MSAASDNLRNNQKQLDADGCMVGVSRQAVGETLVEYDAMLGALKIIAAKSTDTDMGAIAQAGIDIATLGEAGCAAMRGESE